MTNTAVLIHDNTKMCRNCFNDYDKYALKFEELEKKLRNALLKLKWLAAEQNEEHQETEEHNEDQSTSETQHDHTETTTPSRKRSAGHPQARKLQALG